MGLNPRGIAPVTVRVSNRGGDVIAGPAETPLAEAGEK